MNQSSEWRAALAFAGPTSTRRMAAGGHEAHARDRTFPTSLRLHDLRHAFVSIAYNELGLNPRQIAEMSGHRHLSTMLDTYTHVLAGWDTASGPIRAVLIGRPPAPHRRRRYLVNRNSGSSAGAGGFPALRITPTLDRPAAGLYAHYGRLSNGDN